jgi:hypothetical protein
MAAATATVTATTAPTQEKIPNWRVSGDWFDVCKCNILCPCEFAQTPTYEECGGIFAYNIKKGSYGQTVLDGLNILALGRFKDNIWSGDGNNESKLSSLFDEKANAQQREALNMIFSGKAGSLWLNLQSS